MTPKISKPFEGNYPTTFKFGAAPEWYTRITGYPHNGIDFSMVVGVPIFACDDGIIQYADNFPDSDGLGINIGHKWGMSQYWHLSKLIAELSQQVKRGDVIGQSGASGWATGPHLHFGVKYPKDSPLYLRGWANPITYMETEPRSPQPPLIKPRMYFVRPGDNLWKISEKFYGVGYYWKKIYFANMKKIQNPNLIYPFQRLLIP